MESIIKDKEIAEKLNVTGPALSHWKYYKPEQYRVIRNFYLLEKKNFFKKVGKFCALIRILSQECENSPFTKEVFKLINELEDSLKEIDFKEKKQNNLKK